MYCVNGGGLGLSVGVSKTAYGSRRCAFVGQGVGSAFILGGVSLMVGKYEWNKKKRRSRILSKGKTEETLALLLGGFTWTSSNSNSNSKIREAGPAIVFTGRVGSIFGFLGFEPCNLPTDWKSFRKNLGLIADTGKLSDDMQLRIENATTMEG